eukprot:TRINITY_DN47624_c0_g1_i1.p1 TRINITY_DN47624_c0_g1~~TRINITY_DN47624_c0_g1_i1.p1  ORF type:complete len:363 (+),score=108.61 TRINITY_DN47624_c0_g1_i1:66-1091(+)
MADSVMSPTSALSPSSGPRTAYADLLLEIQSLRFRSVKDVPRLAQHGPCYRASWKRGHDGEGSTTWGGPKESGGAFQVEWGHRATLDGLHLPCPGYWAEGGGQKKVKKEVVVTVETMNTRPRPGDPETLGTFRFPLVYESAADGRAVEEEVPLTKDGAPDPFAYVRCVRTLTRISVEGESLARESRRQRKSQRGPEQSPSPLPPAPQPPEDPPDASRTRMLVPLGAPDLPDERTVQQQLQRVHAQIFTMYATLRGKRRDIDYLKQRHAALSDDYDLLKNELQEVERASAEKEHALAAERRLNGQLTDIRDELERWRDDDDEEEAVQRKRAIRSNRRSCGCI